MIRSLRTGISGLKSNQTRLDVTGNNIANVNTVAYKRSRAAFNEVLGQQLLGVGRTAGGSGINPSFVGLGVSVGSIDQNWSQGSLENTGVATDLALNGDGFFIARAGDQNLLTRAGNFTFNREGKLVTANGLNVQGWAYDQDGSLNTGSLEDVMLDFNESTSAKFTKSANNTWSYDIEYAGDETPAPFTDVTGQTLTFNSDGTIDSVGDTTLDWDANYVDGAETIQLDFGDLTQNAGSTTAVFQEQDGYTSGSFDGFSIKPDGTVEANFTNGQQIKKFQLSIGNVNNPNGLEQQGENFYKVSSASGDLQLRRAGRDVKTAVVAGTLEMSNVDLASEFTEMIVAQRGYQAAARIITTSDEIMQETVQLKR